MNRGLTLEDHARGTYNKEYVLRMMVSCVLYVIFNVVLD